MIKAAIDLRDRTGHIRIPSLNWANGRRNCNGAHCHLFSLMDTVPAGSPELAQPPGFADLAIYDDVLPSPASPFRTLEYGHYLEFFHSSVLVSMEQWHFGFAHSGLGDLRANLPIDNGLKGRILAFDAARDLVPKLAYVTFLGNARQLLPYFEARRIPFILQLYPGLGFEPNVRESDDSLRQVVHSPLCRKVIATQKLTREHLLEHIGCAPDKVELIYGGVFETRLDFDFSRDKLRYGIEKESIDLCFVAHRYSDDMTRKGYDQFVEVARLLAADQRIRFHVVGDYTADDLPLGRQPRALCSMGRSPARSSRTFIRAWMSSSRPTAPHAVATACSTGSQPAPVWRQASGGY